MSERNSLLWDSKFEVGYAPHISINFVKIRTSKIEQFLIDHNILKIRWQVVGFLMNYKQDLVIKSLHDQLIAEFPNIKIKYKEIYTWDEDDSYHIGTGGSVRILLYFDCGADEAEFIIRSDSIVSYLKNDDTLIRAS